MSALRTVEYERDSLPATEEASPLRLLFIWSVAIGFAPANLRNFLFSLTKSRSTWQLGICSFSRTKFDGRHI